MKATNEMVNIRIQQYVDCDPEAVGELVDSMKSQGYSDRQILAEIIRSVRC